MKNFCYVKLNDVCELITDGTHQTPTYSESGYIFLSSKNVTNGIIDWENIKYIPEELHKKLYERISPKVGDILLAKNGTTGIAALVDKNIIFDIYVSLALLRPKKNILPEYLLWAINNPYTKRKFQASLKGIGVPNLHLSYIKKTEIKFYDMPQQIYISNLMKKCKRIIDLKKQQLSELDKLVKFQFLKMFGDPILNEKNWKICYLNNISENLDAERIPITAKNRNKGKIPYYGASGIIDYVENYIFNENLLLISEDGANLLTRVLPIAFSVTGKIWVNNHAHVLRFYNSYTQTYIEYLLNMMDISNYITGTAQPKLNQAKLNEILIPFPPIELQNKFAEFVKQVDKSKVIFEKALKIHNFRLNYFNVL